ncbi:metal ABC transporter solute-binding protein, Zn/Mn family [Homoserinibacter sp. GY 40078]|uniref:metal ABC transporter solute-binding protein, Zn/Mn family n=1 Tax=Homoserinibacter sp. GY 40078 TaxID=2603275 RepID=UPI0011C75796|nr:zinc ABC transporter substrate-binding protein [Homoserinibacter sp. GY 40078]TXK19414.1 ABC transporter substrate-binding protein [Homoserinibacter sp. GY 40078]
MTSTRTALLLSATAVTALVLAGCATDGDESSDDAVSIVASTNVYADIAQTVAGDAAEVTAIIHDASQDPHEYEATSRDALAISEADIVVMNGGGYDEFVSTLLDAHTADQVVIDAVDVSGLEGDEHADEGDADDDGDEHADDDGHDHGEFNEHVWYDFDAMDAVAHEIANELGEIVPESAAQFTANADAFADGLSALADRATSISDAHAGAGVAITEPVPLYLLEAAGLVNETPEEFSEAVEEGTDAPVLVVQEVIDLVSDGSIAFLAYNEQTVGPQTEEVLAAAESAGTPVVSFSELLPDGEDYLGWMGANLDAIESALA